MLEVRTEELEVEVTRMEEDEVRTGYADEVTTVEVVIRKVVVATLGRGVETLTPENVDPIGPTRIAEYVTDAFPC